MTSVILQPCGNAAAYKHFKDTILNPVPLDVVAGFVTADEISQLTTIFSAGYARVWGVTAGKNGQNFKKWERVNPGDVTLFSREGAIFASATVAFKAHTTALANSLWGAFSDGTTWEYVYFLDELTHGEIPYTKFNEVVGYKENNIIQGFTVLDAEKSQRVLDTFELESAYYFPQQNKEEYQGQLDHLGTLDRESPTYVRIEQRFLRAQLFGKAKTAECCMCGRVLPISFLVTAHIKKRAHCTLEERKDAAHVVTSMCKLGCDEMFERGHIVVQDGVIQMNPSRQQSTSALQESIGMLVGRSCASWSENSKSYFMWHRAYHGG